MQALDRWRFALTRKRVGLLFVAFNFALLAAVLISISVVGISHTWFDERWLAIPAVISFPSSIEPFLGMYIWFQLDSLVDHNGFAAWDALGASAVVVTGVLTSPISYFTGVAIYHLSRRYKCYAVIPVYMILSAITLFGPYEIATLSG